MFDKHLECLTIVFHDKMFAENRIISYISHILIKPGNFVFSTDKNYFQNFLSLKKIYLKISVETLLNLQDEMLISTTDNFFR